MFPHNFSSSFPCGIFAHPPYFQALVCSFHQRYLVRSKSTTCLAPFAKAVQPESSNAALHSKPSLSYHSFALRVQSPSFVFMHFRTLLLFWGGRKKRLSRSAVLGGTAIRCGSRGTVRAAPCTAAELRFPFLHPHAILLACNHSSLRKTQAMRRGLTHVRQ